MDVTPLQVVVRLNEGEGLEQGDKLFAEIHGVRFCLNLSLAAEANIGSGFLFTIQGAPRLVEAQPGARVLAPPLTARICRPQGDVDVEMHDISETGFGFICHTRLERNELVSLNMMGSTGEVTLHAKIMHCRPLAGSTSHYRAGALITGADRVSTTRWRGLFRLIVDPESAGVAVA